jgi:hypothetical protein
MKKALETPISSTKAHAAAYGAAVKHPLAPPMTLGNMPHSRYAYSFRYVSLNPMKDRQMSWTAARRLLLDGPARWVQAPAAAVPQSGGPDPGTPWGATCCDRDRALEMGKHKRDRSDQSSAFCDVIAVTKNHFMLGKTSNLTQPDSSQPPWPTATPAAGLSALKRVDVRPNWKEQPCASPSPRERAPRAHARVP